MSRQCILKELPAGAALLFAGSQYSPDACIPLSAHHRTAALSNSPVNNSLTKRLLSGIIGRRHSRIKQKSEHVITMLAETPGQGSRLGAFTVVVQLSQTQHAISDAKHDTVESFLRNFVPQMPNMKQSFEFNEQALSKSLIDFSWQRCKEFDIPNQMSQTELLKAVGVFDVSTEKVADNCPAVGFAEDFFKNHRATRPGDVKKTDSRRRKNPYPVFNPVVLPAGLVDIKNRLVRNVLGKFFIRFGQGIVDAANSVAYVGSAHVGIQHFSTELSQTGVGCVKRTLHVCNQRLESRAKELIFDDVSRRLGPHNFSTGRTPISMKAIFVNFKWLLTQFSDLMNLRLSGRFKFTVAAIWTGGRMKFFDMINLVCPKRRTVHAMMAGLSALTARPFGVVGFWRLNDIGRRWLGGVRGVLGKPGHLLGKFCHLCCKFSNLREKFSVLGDKLDVLFFEFSDPSLIKLFLVRFHRLLHLGLLRILSDVHGPCLELRAEQVLVRRH